MSHPKEKKCQFCVFQEPHHSTQNYTRKLAFLKKKSPSAQDVACIVSTNFDQKCQFWLKLGDHYVQCSEPHQITMIGHVVAKTQYG